MPTLLELASDLADGRVTSEQLAEECLARIGDPDGEGARTFLEVDADGAREAARAMDALRRAHAEPSPFAGIPVSVKDVFAVKGQVTRAGSRALRGTPAEHDAPAVARWRRAGLVIVGRTNLTEFAYGGLGINPHYGTPANPWDRATRRIPGGSSSGAAVSLTDLMAHGALGTDTGGSCRIPAALCGVTGFKPTQRRIPRDGVIPLSVTLDSVGVLGRSVTCCAILDALLAEDPVIELPPLRRPPRLAVPRNYVFEDTQPQVSTVFERALERLAADAAEIVDVEWPELDTIPDMNSGGGFAAAEAFAWHHDLMSDRGSDYDPRIRERILRGQQQTARDLLRLRERRARLIDAVAAHLDGFDGFLCPTVPIVPPPLADLEDHDEYVRTNLLLLRNPTIVNLLDGCAASIPMHEPDEPPTGMTVAGLANQDSQILRIAKWIEQRTR